MAANHSPLGGLGNLFPNTHKKQSYAKKPDFKRHDNTSKGIPGFHQLGFGTYHGINLPGEGRETVKSTNYTVIILNALITIGMNPIQDQITDFGKLGESEASVEDDGSNLGSFFSYLEGASTKSGFKSGFWSDSKNYNSLLKAIGFYNRLFNQGEIENNNGTFKGVNPTLHNVNIVINGVNYSGDSKVIEAFLNNAKKALGIPVTTTGSKRVSDITLYILNKLQTKVDGVNVNHSVNVNDLGGVYNVNGDDALTVGAKELYERLTASVNVGGFTHSLAYYMQQALEDNSKMGQLELVLDALGKQFAKDTSSGISGKNGSFFTELYNSLTDLKNLFQGQGSIITNDVQTRTSQMTSYVKIGQTVTSNSDKALKFMVLGTRPG